MGAGTLVVQADGARRYQYNPRLPGGDAQIPKGTIYDRNGLPLATSNWDEAGEAPRRVPAARHRYRPRRVAHRRAPLSARRPDFRPAGRPAHAPALGRRQHLFRRARFGAPPARLRRPPHAGRGEESEDRGRRTRVIRYDYRELVPLLRHRDDPQNPAVRRVLDRPRDVSMSIDARLQVRVAEILREQLKQAGKDKGAAVVLDPATGDLLAAVSLPLPPDAPRDRLPKATATPTRTSTAPATACIRPARRSRSSPPWRRCARIRS